MSGSRRPSTDLAPDRQVQPVNAMERTIYCGESCGSQCLQNGDGVKDKDISLEYVEAEYC